jgi:hypothetical protein
MNGIVRACALTTSQDDQGLSHELFPWQRGKLGPRVIHRYGGTEFFLPQQQRLQTEHFMRKHGTCQTDGQAPFRHHFPHTLRRALFQNHRHAWEAFAVFLKETGKEHARGRADVAEPQFAFLAFGSTAHAPQRLVQAFKNQTRLVQQHGTGRCQPW